MCVKWVYTTYRCNRNLLLNAEIVFFILTLIFWSRKDNESYGRFHQFTKFIIIKINSQFSNFTIYDQLQQIVLKCFWKVNIVKAHKNTWFTDLVVTAPMDMNILETSLFMGDQCLWLSWVTFVHQCTSPWTYIQSYV